MADTERTLQLESIVQRLEFVEKEMVELRLSLRRANNDKAKDP